jgi:DNA-binding transcriptional MerR regulator/methylmalonyl-CoA mutase cobalamin-binding subunit
LHNLGMNGDGDGSPGKSGLSIQQASEMLGVPGPTLRSWERRYGLPLTPRSSGGHRRYDEAALREMVLMRDLIAQGQRAGDAAASVRDLLDEHNPSLTRVTALLAAIRTMEPTAVRAELEAAASALGLAGAVDEVVMPTMRQVGSLWASGRCDVGEEHFATEVIRGWLSRVSVFAPTPLDTGPVVLACGPRDLHTLGLEALGALLSERRVAVRMLGGRTPVRSLVNAVAVTDARAVVVVSSLASQRRSAVESIRAVAETERPAFYAGTAFATPQSRHGVPGTYLGTSVAEAADLLAGSA